MNTSEIIMLKPYSGLHELYSEPYFRTHENIVFGSVSNSPSVPVNEKARDLLLSCLNPVQQKEYQKKQTITVQGNLTQKYYVIYRYQNMNILDIEENTWCCISPVENIPIEDNLLAQVLIIENDEDLFLQQGNRWISLLEDL